MFDAGQKITRNILQHALGQFNNFTISASIQSRVTLSSVAREEKSRSSFEKPTYKDSLSKIIHFRWFSLKTVQFDEVLIGSIRSFLGFNYLTQAADTSISQFNNELENVNDFSKL